MKKHLILAGFCIILSSLYAQHECDKVYSTFSQWEKRLDKLNYEDPELISLHYLFLQDIRKEIDRFRTTELPFLYKCLHLDYYEAKATFLKIADKADKAEQRLSVLKAHVDGIFYERAVEGILFHDTSSALYNIDRALQYNPSNPEALLLKARLNLAMGYYDESVALIHDIYILPSLTEQQERDVSDFTIELYDKLYRIGDSLARCNRSADALEVFLALEQFCSNMPTGYCNDDYYRGILRSREGVYESYLSIAREAERRHNMEMARKFYRYAEEYKNSR